MLRSVGGPRSGYCIFLALEEEGVSCLVKHISPHSLGLLISLATLNVQGGVIEGTFNNNTGPTLQKKHDKNQGTVHDEEREEHEEP